MPVKQQSMLMFVYGSLMRGLHNNDFLRGAWFLREDETLPGYRLHALISIVPGVVHDPAWDGVVKGELWQVPEELWLGIDMLESSYGPTKILLASGDEALTYLWPNGTTYAPQVLHGDWRKHIKGRL